MTPEDRAAATLNALPATALATLSAFDVVLFVAAAAAAIREAVDAETEDIAVFVDMLGAYADDHGGNGNEARRIARALRQRAAARREAEARP